MSENLKQASSKSATFGVTPATTPAASPAASPAAQSESEGPGTRSGHVSGSVSGQCSNERKRQSDDSSEELESSLDVSLQEISAPSPRARLTSLLKAVLKISIAAGLIFWMVREGALDFRSFAQLKSPWVIGFCVACIFAQVFVNNYRWLLLMRGQGLATSIGQTLPLSFIGLFFNFVMPGGVGGDVVKGYYLLHHHPQKKFAAAVSVVMDRLLGFFVMIGTAFLALFFNWERVSQSAELRSIAVGVVALFFAFLLFFLFSFSRLLHRVPFIKHFLINPPGAPNSPEAHSQAQGSGPQAFVHQPSRRLHRLRHQLHRRVHMLYSVLHSYRAQPSSLFAAIALSAVAQLLLVGFVFVVGRAMGYSSVPLSIYFFLVPIGVVVQALPISPAGVGVGQAAFFFLFNLYLGEESQLGPTAVTSMQLVQFFWGLLGAVFYLRMKRPRVEEPSSILSPRHASSPADSPDERSSKSDQSSDSGVRVSP